MSFIFLKSITFFLASCNFAVTEVIHVRVGIKPWITSNDTLGPIYNIFCGTDVLCTRCIYSWSLHNKSIASNGAVVEGDASRFSVQVERNVTNSEGIYFYGDILQIRNALKNDLGVYECHVSLDYQTGSVKTNVLQPFSFYLPPSAYPECTISPSKTMLENSYVTFACTPGESNPPVSLTLLLQRPDGSEIHLGNESVTRQVTVEDNNAVFICHMTSETFLTVDRNCSVSSLTVIQPTITAEATLSPQTSAESESIENNNSSPIYGTVGGIIGAVLIVLILIMTVYILVKQFRSQESNPSERAINYNEQDGRASNQGNVDNSTIVQTPGHIPLYSVVNKTTSSEENPPNIEETAIYEDTHVTDPTEAYNGPIYSQVNKGYKTDESRNDISDNGGSGMVENTIYVSAGPK